MAPTRPDRDKKTRDAKSTIVTRGMRIASVYRLLFLHGSMISQGNHVGNLVAVSNKESSNHANGRTPSINRGICRPLDSEIRLDAGSHQISQLLLLTLLPHTTLGVNQRFKALMVNPFFLHFLNCSSVAASHSMRLSHERLPNLGVPRGDVIWVGLHLGVKLERALTCGLDQSYQRPRFLLLALHSRNFLPIDCIRCPSAQC